MGEDKDIVKVENVSLGSLQVDPEQIIARATHIATELGKVIESKHLFANIQGKKFVTVEGWSTLGALLGVLPREVETRRFDDGAYEATVELIRASDQAIIGKASSYVGMDEIWGKRQEYARRSMALTRATGKAYRLGFSWIIKLAGYEPTPAEEMPVDAEFKDEPPVGVASKLKQVMTIEDAAEIESTDGRLYKDMDIPALSAIFNAHNKKLADQTTPQSDKPRIERDNRAIQLIIAEKNKKEKK